MSIKQLIHGCLLFHLFLGWVPASFAEATHFDTARKSFLAAEVALAQGNSLVYETIKKRLAHYPLLPYLIFAEYDRRIQSVTHEEFQAFMDKYPDSPLAEQLRIRWLQAKAKQEDWKSFLKAYQPTEDVSLQCHYLWASLQNPTNPNILLKQISALWLTGKQTPKSCEAVFSIFEKTSAMTRPMVWQRVKSAIEAGNETIARKTAQHLKRSELALVELWLMVHANPYLVTQHKYFNNPHPANLEMIADGVCLIAKTNPDTAIKIWQQIARRYKFEERHWGLVVRAIGLAYAFQRHPDAEKWLSQVPAIYANQTVQEWRIRVALAKEDWPKVYHWVRALPSHLAKVDEWEYWHARALERINRRHDSQIILTKLAKTRGYYGFLASNHLLQPYHILNHKTPVERSMILNMAGKSSILRARELQILGRQQKAKAEWLFITKQMNDTEKHAAAHIALKWNLPNWAMLALSKSENKNDLSLRFPVVYGNHILQEGHKNQIDPAWILAITRQESAFIPHAKNPSGATGLMQLRHSTAREVADRKKIAYFGESQLIEPYTNIQLGSGYLRMMLDQHQNNAVLASAAYNAGPGRIKKWLPDNDMAADLWIETIPFKETREYVKNVMTSTVIYQEILGRKPTLAEHMPFIPGK
jgi:soluble lytic murein transglycosylase